ncbi:MAG TPA: hypothetical protein VF006_27870 [Longimicrobium sp.]
MRAAGAAAALPLARELAEGRIRSALLCHVHDRWYLGELFCHASWVTCLERAGIRVSVCTNPHYLELFERHPAVDRLYPAEALEEAMAAPHDLVVFATTHPPAAWRPEPEHALYAWNTGMAYARRGSPGWSRRTDEPNLFVATAHRHGDTALPDAGAFAMRLGPDERRAASCRITGCAGGGGAPILVVNPTASNPHTRQSTRPKAVDNLLDTADYAALVEGLLRDFPAHRLLVAAALKPGDDANLERMRELADAFRGHPRVFGVAGDARARDGISLREFAALLVDGRVQGMVGNSTGSNAHLAAAVGVPSLSIERGAGDEMRANWADPARGQMGSFRWRNPHPLAAAFTLPWEGRTPDHLARVSRTFRGHLHALRGEWERLFGFRAAESREAARVFLELSACGDGGDADGRAWAAAARTLAASFADPWQAEACFDLRDEADYLRITGAVEAADALDAIDGRAAPAPERLSACTRQVLWRMIGSSNLAKLARVLADAASAPPLTASA